MLYFVDCATWCKFTGEDAETHVKTFEVKTTDQELRSYKVEMTYDSEANKTGQIKEGEEDDSGKLICCLQATQKSSDRFQTQLRQQQSDAHDNRYDFLFDPPVNAGAQLTKVEFYFEYKKKLEAADHSNQHTERKKATWVFKTRDEQDSSGMKTETETDDTTKTPKALHAAFDKIGKWVGHARSESDGTSK